jgi:hypothetical protein
MENLIYTPLPMVIANQTRDNGNYQTCTKINYYGFEISVASDQSLCAGNELQRTEIRIYKDNHDVTDRFVKHYNDNNCFQTNMFTSPEDLHFIMDTILKHHRGKFPGNVNNKDSKID